MSIVYNGKKRKESFVVSRNASLEDYIIKAEELYNKMVVAEDYTVQLESFLREIRSQGFKVIIIGTEVKVTY